MAQQGGGQDTLAVPAKQHHGHAGLNEDLVRILRENLLQQEQPRAARRRSPTISPRLSPTMSPRNSPRLLRRMLIGNNIHKQRRSPWLTPGKRGGSELHNSHLSECAVCASGHVH
ncbi:hypothetical protein AAFF_G00031010 [Aldrovandia affinis]|uniref:Uncharacterized protein n=1 Tax=Aldrovandia affinis TaxID=143900 RepID=A0AAD7S450_9TELE|nr:hypothetical protein AAFF_G00031010 [Aldrovandia affinis]